MLSLVLFLTDVAAATVSPAARLSVPGRRYTRQPGVQSYARPYARPSYRFRDYRPSYRYYGPRFYPFLGLGIYTYPYGLYDDYDYPYYSYADPSYAPGEHRRFQAFRLPGLFLYPGALGKGESGGQP